MKLIRLTLNRGANYPEDVAYSSTYSLKEYRDQARLRGKQMMLAMTSEFPDIEVITAHGPYLSESSAPGPLFPGWQTANELIEPLFVGFMEGLNGTAKNIDGGELYTLRSASDFQKTYDWRKTTIASNIVNSGLYLLKIAWFGLRMPIFRMVYMMCHLEEHP